MEGSMIELQTCLSCGCEQYPSRSCCRKCLSTDLVLKPSEAAASVLGFSDIYASLETCFNQASPWRIALIRIGHDSRLLCHTRAKNLNIGDPVKLQLDTDPAGQRRYFATALEE